MEQEITILDIETCPECGSSLDVSEQGKVAVCNGCGYTEA